MKNLSNKQKIVFVVTLIFFCTSVAIKIKNFNINRKSMNKEKAFMEKKIDEESIKLENDKLDYIKDKSKDNLNVNSNKNFQSKEEVKNKLADLWNTLDEATSYLKNNIDNKDKREEILVLIDDCISALNSMENVSTKIKYEDVVNAPKDIKKIKEDFKELKKTFKEYNLDRCKKLLN